MKGRTILSVVLVMGILLMAEVRFPFEARGDDHPEPAQTDGVLMEVGPDFTLDSLLMIPEGSEEHPREWMLDQVNDQWDTEYFSGHNMFEGMGQSFVPSLDKIVKFAVRIRTSDPAFLGFLIFEIRKSMTEHWLISKPIVFGPGADEMRWKTLFCDQPYDVTPGATYYLVFWSIANNALDFGFENAESEDDNYEQGLEFVVTDAYPAENSNWEPRPISFDMNFKTWGVDGNHPPYTPSNPHPSNGASNQGINVNVEWSGGDPDSDDTVTYDVYFGEQQSPPLVGEHQVSTTYDPGSLDYDKRYYWKIIAWDNHEATAEGPVWHFTTVDAPPEPPTVETLDADDITGTSATLRGKVTNDGGEACKGGFRYREAGSGSWQFTGWSGSHSSGDRFSRGVSDLTPGTDYEFRAGAKNSATDGVWGEIRTFRTLEPLPDLAVTLIKTAPEYFLPGDGVGMQFTLDNIGDADATEPFRQELYLDGGFLTEYILPGLPVGPGGTHNYGIGWPNDYQYHEFCVLVDVDNTITESDEENEFCESFRAHLPDLAVVDIWTYPAVFPPGSPINVYAKIENLASDMAETQNWSTLLRIEDDEVEERRYEGLMHGESVELEFWATWPLAIGKHLIEIWADSDKEVSEEDEDNNYGSWERRGFESWNLVNLGLGGAFGLNEAGLVAGYMESESGELLGTIWNPQIHGREAIEHFPSLGGTVTVAMAINEAGEVTGYSETAVGENRAFLYLPEADYGLEAGTNDLGTLGGPESFGYDLREGGVVAGAASVDPPDFHAFFWLPLRGQRAHPGMNDMGTLGGNNSRARGINSLSQIVGFSDLSVGGRHAFLWLPMPAHGLPPGMNDLGTLGDGSHSEAYGINVEGTIVGRSCTQEDSLWHAFVWLPEEAHGLQAGMNDIGTLGGVESQGLAVTDSCIVVGWAETESGDRHAVLYDEYGMIDLNEYIEVGGQWVLREAWDINTSGQIVGIGDHDGRPSAFLLTPSYDMLAAGVERDPELDGEAAAPKVRRVQNYPNPFDPKTSIAFSLGESGFTSLRVYDSMGRLVSTLVNGHLDEGAYRYSWDGRDNQGRPVAAGVYFYAVRSGGMSLNGRMVLSK